jgi:hypothetical protein
MACAFAGGLRSPPARPYAPASMESAHGQLGRGSGFSGRQLERYRQFYRTFPIASALRTQLGRTHYKTLISLDNADKREFYLSEATKNNWSARQLERQVNSQLFECLLLSNDVAAVMAVARQESRPRGPAISSKTP